MDNMQVLIISPNWLGDAVMAMPAVRRFRLENAGCTLVMLAKPAVAALWRMHGSVDEVVVLDKGNQATVAIAKSLRLRRFSKAYILPNSFRSALIAYLGGVKLRRGTACHARALMINDPVTFKDEEASGRKLHQSHEYMKLLCGTADGDLSDTGFHPTAPAWLEELRIGEDETPVCIIPGAARGDSKRWPYFAEAAKLIARESPTCRFIVTGAKAEAGLCRRVADEIGERAVCVAGRTGLSEFAALLGHCRLVLCNDSGGMHLASAAGAPVVAVFGLTDPAKTGPIGRHATVIQPDGVRASRDIARHSAAAVSALASISPEKVAAACLEKLAGG